MRVALVPLSPGQTEVLIRTCTGQVPFCPSTPQHGARDGGWGLVRILPPGCTGTKLAVWVQVKVLELEKRLEGERVRLGELRKQHYGLAGAYEAAEEGEAKPAPAPRRGILKKPPLAQKPSLGEVGSPGGKCTRWGAFTARVTDISFYSPFSFQPERDAGL